MNLWIARGNVTIMVRRTQRAPLWWHLGNLSHVLPGLLLDKIARLWGLNHLTARLYLRLCRADGQWVDYGLVATRCVTTGFVNLMVDTLQGSGSNWANFKYHDSGTGTNSESSSDTALQTPCTVQSGDERATGTQTEGASANIYKSVGTISYTDSAAITEHGLFNNTRAGGGVLLDRSVFSAVNVVNGDSIQFTYELTCTAGG